MQRKTKEEVLIDNGIKYGVLNANGKQQMLNEMVHDGTGPEGISMLQAMQEYADQEMEAFAKWIAENGYRIYHAGWAKFSFIPGITTNQLIALYKKEVENG